MRARKRKKDEEERGERRIFMPEEEGVNSISTVNTKGKECSRQI